MKSNLHSLVTKINDSLYENRSNDYDRAKDFYIEGKSNEELIYIAGYLIQYSKYFTGRRSGDKNKGRKEKMLNDIRNLREQFYQYGFMEKELDLLNELLSVVKKKEIKSEKQQVIALCESVKTDLTDIHSTDTSINEIVKFLKKALPEINNNRENYKHELEQIESLL